MLILNEYFMESFDFEIEQEFNPLVHVEKKLGFYDQEMYQLLAGSLAKLAPTTAILML